VPISKTRAARATAPIAQSSEHPTLIPAFDPEAFARDSEIKQRAALTVGGEPTIARARQLHAEGEHERALFLLAGLLDLAPLHPEATKLSSECGEALERECLSCVGSDSAVLVAALSPDELKRFGLDKASSLLVSLVNGTSSVKSILDVSGLPRLLALRHLRKLIERGLVVVAFVRGQGAFEARPTSEMSGSNPAE
jgi:hypothetical protein